MGPWNNWYHCVGNTYGTWLPGDPRGWRSRDHRCHCEGDYKNPPAKGRYDTLHQQSQLQMKRDEIRLNDEAMRVVCNAFSEKFRQKQINIAAIAITHCGYHVLGQFDDRKPQHWIGMAKRHSSFKLVEADLASRGGIWATRGLCKPITDEKHWENARAYILKHDAQGAEVWGSTIR